MAKAGSAAQQVWEAHQRVLGHEARGYEDNVGHISEVQVGRRQHDHVELASVVRRAVPKRAVAFTIPRPERCCKTFGRSFILQQVARDVRRAAEELCGRSERGTPETRA